MPPPRTRRRPEPTVYPIERVACRACHDTGWQADRKPCTCDGRPFDLDEPPRPRPEPTAFDRRAVLRLDVATGPQSHTAVELRLAIDQAMQTSSTVLGRLIRTAQWSSWLDTGPPAAAGAAITVILDSVDLDALALAVDHLRTVAREATAT